MSNPVRIAIVAEGRTDQSVLNAGIVALVGNRAYTLRLLQPEDPAASAPFGVARPFGWTGVYRWCREAVDRAGRLRDDVVLERYDIVILHLDADVSTANYPGAHINDAPNPNDLPCAHPVCPPCSNSTNPLRLVMLAWVGEAAAPPKSVLCTPSSSIEAWVLAGLYPGDPAVVGGNLECLAQPANLLQAKPANERLISGGKKNVNRYVAREPDITAAWPNIRLVCTEAQRFSVDFDAAIPP